MSRELKITMVVENTTPGHGLIGEHGLAVHIQDGDHAILFDTGQSGSALLGNAQRLGVDLAKVSTLALSHGHYDHTGGLSDFFSVSGDVQIILHEDALTPTYKCAAGQPVKPIGIPGPCLESLQDSSRRLTITSDPVSITERLSTTGQVPRKTNFEDVGGPFFLDTDGKVPDLIESDQSLWIRTDEGPVVVLGCAHAGVVNTLNRVSELSGEKRIHAVIGGMHLGSASVERLKATVEALREYGVKLLAPCHCTGNTAKEVFAREFPAEYVQCRVGTVFSGMPLRMQQN